MNVRLFAVLAVMLSPSALANCEKVGHTKLQDFIESAAAQFNLDPNLLLAVAKVESNLDSCAVSVKGAGGIMQLMPLTAKSLGVSDVFDAQQNINGGAQHLAKLVRLYKIPQLYLAAYNAGETAVDRKGYVPDYPETRGYIRKVIKKYRSQADINDDYQAIQSLTQHDPLDT